jgi:hypothetical protein
MSSSRHHGFMPNVVTPTDLRNFLHLSANFSHIFFIWRVAIYSCLRVDLCFRPFKYR